MMMCVKGCGMINIGRGMGGVSGGSGDDFAGFFGDERAGALLFLSRVPHGMG